MGLVFENIKFLLCSSFALIYLKMIVFCSKEVGSSYWLFFFNFINFLDIFNMIYGS